MAELKTTLLTQVNTALGNLWNGQVMPGLMGNPAGATVMLADVRSDDEGLKVKVDIDPAQFPNLITSPGLAVDAGTTSDLDAVLSERDTTEGFGSGPERGDRSEPPQRPPGALRQRRDVQLLVRAERERPGDGEPPEAGRRRYLPRRQVDAPVPGDQVPFLKATLHTPASNAATGTCSPA